MQPILFESPEQCCACGACMVTCPRGAITMSKDSYGFLLPQIDFNACIGCGACMRVCRFNNNSALVSQGPWYAGAGKGDISNSSSGGAFASFAEVIIRDGGVAFGAACVNEDEEIHVVHQAARTMEEIGPLKNSKYVQSNAWTCYKEVKAELEMGARVLFSGTPCQVAGLKGYLGKDWENLITVDLVCHGVPSQDMFNSWLKDCSSRFGSQVTGVRFRSKENGWGQSVSTISLKFVNGDSTILTRHDCAYYDLFLQVKTLRDSCYVCPFAGKSRSSDITIGDFWGIAKRRPDVLLNDGLSLKRGISCVLVNSERGYNFLMGMHDGLMTLKEVDFEDIAVNNPQLRRPSLCPTEREAYLDAYREGGWRSLEKQWRWRERGPLYHAKRIAKRIGLGRVRSFLKRKLGNS